jgi:DNA polymerase-3 subunit delta
MTDTRVFLRPAGVKETEKVDCNPMGEEMVVRMILQNKKFTPDAAVMLARVCENNFAAVSNEMEKAMAFYHDKSAIDREDIAQIVSKTEKYQIYELSNAIMKKDTAKAVEILQTFTLLGVDEYAVFGNLVAFCRRLFYAKTSPQPDAAVAAFLGLKPYAVTFVRRDGRITAEKAADIYAKALDLEYQIKSGKILAGRAAVLLTGAFL